MSQLALITCCHIVALSDVNSISYVKSDVFFVEHYTNAKYYYYFIYDFFKYNILIETFIGHILCKLM